MEPWLALLALIRLAPEGAAGQDPNDGPGTSRRLPKRYLVLAAAAGVLAVFVAAEMRQSRLQAELFSLLASKMAFRPTPGASSSMRAAPDGPYDHRLGYSRLPAMLERLHAEGFEIEAQAQWSPELAEWVDAGLFPIYQEKPQAGFTLLDRNGELLHRSPHPQRLYPSFAAIPQSVVESLLFIENRDMLDARFATRNPAIEWDRLSKAGLDLGLRSILPSHPVSGGSTLATQLEKLRHSEAAARKGVHESSAKSPAHPSVLTAKARQTSPQQRIVADYINSIPLAAVAGHGEVIGLGEDSTPGTAPTSTT
ncbi:MAG: transglycosylase domain-containing protein [Bryobacterales bacterium]